MSSPAIVDDVVCASMPTPFSGGRRVVLGLQPGQRRRGPRAARHARPSESAVASRRAAGGRPGQPMPRSMPPAVCRPRDVLDDLIGDARIVLIGESSHGTHEFYEARAEHHQVADRAQGLQRRCRRSGLAGRLPSEPVRSRARRRRARPSRRCADSNGSRPGCGATRWSAISSAGCADAQRPAAPPRASREAGFYGLDLYSLHRSMQEVITYLEGVDPRRPPERARARYACFDHSSGNDGQAYGFAAAFGAGPSCERQAVEQLIDLPAKCTWRTCASRRQARRGRTVLRPAKRA